ncbi:MAG: diacylglycerol/polyprenol kinase family protein [Candidatus Hermodarchaeota archaeon]
MSIQIKQVPSESDEKAFSAKSEFLRKFFHLLPLLIPLFFALGIPEFFIRAILISLFMILTPVEFYRLKVPTTRLNRLLRAKEVDKLASYYMSCLIAAILAIFVVDFVILEISLVASNLGDASAALIGKTIGRHLLPLTKTKTIEGTIAGFFCAFASCFIFFLEKNIILIFIYGIVVGLTVVITDFIESPKIFYSDNLLNPLLSAIGLIFVTCSFL